MLDCHCDRCADFSPLALRFVDTLRLLRIQWLDPDLVFAMELDAAWWRRTKDFSRPK